MCVCVCVCVYVCMCVRVCVCVFAACVCGGGALNLPDRVYVPWARRARGGAQLWQALSGARMHERGVGGGCTHVWFDLMRFHAAVAARQHSPEWKAYESDVDQEIAKVRIGYAAAPVPMDSARIKQMQVSSLCRCVLGGRGCGCGEGGAHFAQAHVGATIESVMEQHADAVAEVCVRVCVCVGGGGGRAGGWL